MPQGVVPVVRGVTQRLFQHRRAARHRREPQGAYGRDRRRCSQTTGLTRQFGGVTAVEAVDFALGEVELRCLIGPNGAGKSTFFKMLTGQLAPTCGVGEVPRPGHHRREDRTRSRVSASASRRRCRMCSTGCRCMRMSLSPPRAVIRRHRARTIVAEVLTRTGLTDIADRIVGQLAHGQRQWVEIGAVLAQEPDLILLDEPAAGMTFDEVVRTSELIREINRTQALIVVEHDMQFIRMIAKTRDRVQPGTHPGGGQRGRRADQPDRARCLFGQAAA